MSSDEFDREQFRTLQQKAVDSSSGELHLSNLSDEEVRTFARQMWAREREPGDSIRALSKEKDVLDHAPLGISICREEEGNHPIIYMNNAFLDLFGYEEHELLNKDHRILQGEETDPDRVARLAEAIQKRQTVTVELRNYRKDGTMFWNRLTVAPLVTSPDESPVFVGFQEDVTGRRKMEQKYRDRVNILQDINDSMPGVTYEFRRHPDGSYSFGHMSDGFQQLCGVTSEEAMRDFDRAMEPVHPNDREELLTSIETSANQMTPWKHEYRYQYPEGEETWVLGSSIPEKRDGGVIAWRGVLIDITRRKSLEQELKAQVRETERVSKLKSDFVARATHDLRTPLNSILGLTSILRDTDLSATQERHVEGIRSAGQSMLFLVNDILDLDRIESDSIELNPKPVEIRSVLYEAMTLFRTEVSESNLTFTETIAEEVPQWVRADPERLQRILINLVGNAVKFTSTGRVDVQIDCPSRENDEITLRCSVSDTGPGIPEDERKNIFIDREQGSDTTAIESSGAGLGLSICQHLVRLMNGEIHVESEVGEGSTFTFTVQLDLPDAEEVPDPDMTKRSVDEAEVLVVDDSAPIRQLVRRLLEDAGVEVTTVDNGAEALDLLTESSGERFDTVFLDRRLGDTTGPQVIRDLRASGTEVRPQKIFVLTGDSESDVLQEVPEDHIAGVVSKPVSESELLRSVRRSAKQESDSTVSTDVLERSMTKELQDLNLQVLVVDDDREARRVLNLYLKDVAERTYSAEDGESALETYHEQVLDLVLLDVEMPGMDGVEVTERIRRHEKEQQLEPVPIILQSALAVGDTAEKSIEAGASEFLTKPVDRTNLYRTMLDVLKKSSDGTD